MKICGNRQNEKRSQVGKFLRALLNQKQLILTSRPYGVPPTTRGRKQFDRTIENMGFSNEQIEEYIRRVTVSSDNSEKEAKDLISHLKKNTSLWGIAHIPINLNLLCQLYFSEAKFDFTAGISLTEIYTSMCEHWLRHYGVKQGILEDEDEARELSFCHLKEKWKACNRSYKL